MVRYIDAEKLLEVCKTDSWARAYEPFAEDIENAPTEDVAPIKHGKWSNGICSHCGVEKPIVKIYRGNNEIVYQYQGELNYCPNCGAKMDEEK